MLQILKIHQKRYTVVRFSTSPISAKIGLNTQKNLPRWGQNEAKIALLVVISAILAPTWTQVALKIASNSKSWDLLAGIWLESRRPDLQDHLQELPRPSPGHNFHTFCSRKSFNSEGPAAEAKPLNPPRQSGGLPLGVLDFTR